MEAGLTLTPATGDVRLDVDVWYLELPEDAPVLPLRDLPFEVVEVPTPDVLFYRFLYNTVGQDWIWWRKRQLSDNELASMLAQPYLRLYVFYKDGQPVGFVELDLSSAEAADIAYFGLMPSAIGKGFGKAALSSAIAKGRLFAPKVTLNTCSADHPRALDNYLSAGFKQVGTASQTWHIPEALGFNLSRFRNPPVK